MYRKISEVLGQYLYEEIALNVSGVHLALRQEAGLGYVVVTVDETAGIMFSAEQFHHISEQIRVFLQKRGCYHSSFLYLLVTEDDSSRERLFHNYESVWRIQPSLGKVMAYENSDVMFDILLKPLEDRFAWQGYERVQYGGAAVPQRREIWIPYCTVGLIVLNILVFLCTELVSGEWLVDAGALSWYAVLEEGQWYRLITSMFLHGGIDHIFNNMLMLGFIGYYLEKQLGGLFYGMLYFLSGILAGCMSMVYNMLQNEYVVSIGASGAIFGTVGAMLFLVFYYRGKAGQYTVRQVAVMTFFSLYGGFTSQGVDNAAHIGGFIGGFILSMLFLPIRRRQHRRKADRRRNG